MWKRIILLAILPLMFSCQEKFNGKDEESFKISREKIEQNLNKNEKVSLEKALRVVALEAMRLKWEETPKYNGKSFNKISLELIDGLSFSSVVDLAEDILKERNTKEIKQLSSEIDSLNIQKNGYLEIKNSLNLFKISSVKIDKVDFMNESVPELEIEYQYIGKNKLLGPKEISFKLYKKSNKETLKSQISTFGDDESILESGETLTEQLILSQTKETNPQIWNARRYPIEKPNLAEYDLELEVEVISLLINGKKMALPKADISQLDAEIKAKNERISELKTTKSTLDELELTEE